MVLDTNGSRCSSPRQPSARSHSSPHSAAARAASELLPVAVIPDVEAVVAPPRDTDSESAPGAAVGTCDATCQTQQPAADRAALLKEAREAARAEHCIVCHDEKPSVLSLCCGAAFHAACLAKWAAEQPTCPQCRADVLVLDARAIPAVPSPATFDAQLVDLTNALETARAREAELTRRVHELEGQRASSDSEVDGESAAESGPPECERCTNTAAYACTNGCCFACCMQWGQRTCYRHNHQGTTRDDLCRRCRCRQFAHACVNRLCQVCCTEPLEDEVVEPCQRHGTDGEDEHGSTAGYTTTDSDTW